MIDIRVNEGRVKATIWGSVDGLIADSCVIIRSVYEALAEDGSQELADKYAEIITEIVKRDVLFDDRKREEDLDRMAQATLDKAIMQALKEGAP